MSLHYACYLFCIRAETCNQNQQKNNGSFVLSGYSFFLYWSNLRMDSLEMLHYFDVSKHLVNSDIQDKAIEGGGWKAVQSRYNHASQI